MMVIALRYARRTIPAVCVPRMKQAYATVPSKLGLPENLAVEQFVL